jgi:uncharacterized protein
MHYYIDGYNLLFRILRAGDEVRKQREEITFELEKKIALLELDATLVFDSHYQEGESEKSHYKSLEIIFTAKDETADDFILHELKHSKTPSLHTVVTSDKKLASLCRLRLAETQSVEEFLTWIDKRYKNKLRQNRQQAKPTLPIAVPKETKKPEPVPKDSAEGCFDFYLETFSKTYESLEQPPPPKQESPKPKKTIKKPPIKEKDHLSDHDRWLKAFEERIEQD